MSSRVPDTRVDSPTHSTMTETDRSRRSPSEKRTESILSRNMGVGGEWPTPQEARDVPGHVYFPRSCEGPRRPYQTQVTIYDKGETKRRFTSTESSSLTNYLINEPILPFTNRKDKPFTFTGVWCI